MININDIFKHTFIHILCKALLRDNIDLIKAIHLP